MSRAIFEYSVLIRRTYCAHFFKQDERETIDEIRSRIAILIQDLGTSRTKTMQKILMAGIETLEQQVKDEKKEKVYPRGSEQARLRADIKELTRLQKQFVQFMRWEPIYDDLGYNGFVEWCDEGGHPAELVERFLDDYSWKTPERKQSDRDKEWLYNFLKGKGEVATPIIKAAATRDNIIENDDEWNRIKQAAKRMKISSGKHGHWHLS